MTHNRSTSGTGGPDSTSNKGTLPLPLPHAMVDSELFLLHITTSLAEIRRRRGRTEVIWSTAAGACSPSRLIDLKYTHNSKENQILKMSILWYKSCFSIMSEERKRSIEFEYN